MLGLYPLGSRAIAESTFGLSRIEEAMSAALDIALTIGAIAGIVVPISASLGLELALSGNWITRQYITANATITFGGTPTLHVLGQPIKLTAMPQSFTLRAAMDSYTLKALPEQFTIRGVR